MVGERFLKLACGSVVAPRRPPPVWWPCRPRRRDPTSTSFAATGTIQQFTVPAGDVPHRRSPPPARSGGTAPRCRVDTARRSRGGSRSLQAPRCRSSSGRPASRPRRREHRSWRRRRVRWRRRRGLVERRRWRRASVVSEGSGPLVVAGAGGGGAGLLRDDSGRIRRGRRDARPRCSTRHRSQRERSRDGGHCRRRRWHRSRRPGRSRDLSRLRAPAAAVESAMAGRTSRRPAATGTVAPGAAARSQHRWPGPLRRRRRVPRDGCGRRGRLPTAFRCRAAEVATVPPVGVTVAPPRAAC